ncbi:MAG TPA: hypothetical protein VGD99_13605 [Anaerolineae bacterium]
MACQKQGQRCANAASRNGIWGQVSRYLNTVGSWSTYRDLQSLDEIPGRVEQLTGAFFGLGGGRLPRLASLLGVIIGVHALEQGTAAVATSGMRLVARGQPLAKYRGVIVRRSPLTGRLAPALNRVTGGRLQQATGYYFHEAGRTWHCQSFTVDIKGTPRTLTHIRSFSLPHREHFFDRPLTLGNGAEEALPIGDDGAERSVSIQRVIDTIMGDEDPGAIPGYIGSTNELENATGVLGGFKRVLFAANWFLVDESERDLPPAGPDFVDYDALVEGRPPGQSGGGYYQVTRPGGPDRGAPGSVYGSRATTARWPSTTRGTVIPVRTTGETSSRPYGAQLFRSGPQPTPAASSSTRSGQVYADPYEQIKARYQAPNGQHYPLIVKRLMLNPITQTEKAEAVFYNGELKKWREIVEDDAREALAREVRAGRLTVSTEEKWPA